jgi:hypothetical protein
MAQSFDCLCNTPTCRGRIAGARDMTPRQLEGLWLNGHIRALLEERDGAGGPNKTKVNGTHGTNGTYGTNGVNGTHGTNGTNGVNGTTGGAYDAAGAGVSGVFAGAQRRGPTSRELSGEMGGDTSVAV